jgi:hypothetical protein
VTTAPESTEDDFAAYLKKMWNDTWSQKDDLTTAKLLSGLSQNFGILQVIVKQLERGDNSEDSKEGATKAAMLLSLQAYVLARFMSEMEDEKP